MYLVEVSKVVGPSRLFAPENVVCVGGGLDRSMDWSLPWSAGVQANL